MTTSSTFRYLRLILAFLTIDLSACTSVWTNADMGAPSPLEKLEALRSGLRPLDLGTPTRVSPQTAAYLEANGLVVEGAEHHIGTFRSGPHRLSAHVYLPASARATVVLVHGYYDHAGVLRHAIAYLVALGYAVAVYDQPGHGLSSGERASIDDFSTYASALAEFVWLCRAELPHPVHVVAHSLGAAVTMDYLLATDAPPIERVVLLAPLVHSRHWASSRLAVAVASLFVDSVPRVFRETSSDRTFLERVRADPLQPRRVPLAWFRALVAWNERFDGYKASLVPVKVIQGTADSIVDWRYSIARVEAKFPEARTLLLEGARHHLLNERPVLRGRVLALIDTHLSSDVALRE